MPTKTILLAAALLLGTLSSISVAIAGDPYGGFGPGGTDTQAAGSDPNAGVPAAGGENMGSTQQPDQMGNNGDSGGGIGGDEQTDDESGH